MKKFLLSCLVIFVFALKASANHVDNINAEAALKRLKTGNQNFSHMHLHHPDVSKKRLVEIEKSQHPFVAIISCSDSRVPPEIIFDQGLGDLFEIRNAGNVFDEHVTGSIEYAIVHLGVKLIVIMGHQDCGAVKATMAHTHESKYIESLTQFIEPSYEKAKTQKGDLVDNTVKNNTLAVAKELLNADSIIDDYVKHHNVKIYTAFYNMHTGLVEFSEFKQ